MINELTISVQIVICEWFIKFRFKSIIYILNTYVYILLAIAHNIVIPGYIGITLHIFFLVLFGNKKCFSVRCSPVTLRTLDSLCPAYCKVKHK